MKSPTGRSPWPGKQRKCRLQDSTSRPSFGASASCTRKILSAGIDWIGGDRKRRRQRVEAVENDPDRLVIGAAHDLPGVAIVVDVTPPGQRLEADAQAARGGRSPSSRKSAAARSMPPSEAGETLLQISSRSVCQVPASGRTCARRARNCGRAAAPACPRNRGTAGTRRSQGRGPRQIWPTSRGLPLNDSRSFSKISTASKPAAAMARSFSSSAPLSETVAIERLFMRPSP